MDTLILSQGSTAPPVSAPCDVRPKLNMHAAQIHIQQQGTSMTKDATVRQYPQPNTELLQATPRNIIQNVNTTSTAATSTQEQCPNGLHSAPSPASVQNIGQDTICKIMQHQNEITTMLMQQQMSATLPQRNIAVFDGDPLQCISFIQTFEHCIEAKASSYQDCLYYLEQFTRGQPRAVVRSCLHMPPHQGYERAKALLKEHFGNEYTIATAYMDKAFGWPVIKNWGCESTARICTCLKGVL